MIEMWNRACGQCVWRQETGVHSPSRRRTSRSCSISLIYSSVPLASQCMNVSCLPSLTLLFSFTSCPYCSHYIYTLSIPYSVNLIQMHPLYSTNDRKQTAKRLIRRTTNRKKCFVTFNGRVYECTHQKGS